MFRLVSRHPQARETCMSNNLMSNNLMSFEARRTGLALWSAENAGVQLPRKICTEIIGAKIAKAKDQRTDRYAVAAPS